MIESKKFKTGDRVICNGNNESYVLNYYTDKIVTVRIWRGQRHIGDTIVNESELKLTGAKLNGLTTITNTNNNGRVPLRSRTNRQG